MFTAKLYARLSVSQCVISANRQTQIQTRKDGDGFQEKAISKSVGELQEGVSQVNMQNGRG